MVVPICVARHPSFLAVLLGFVVLLPVLEQAVLTLGIVRADLRGIVSRPLGLTGTFPAGMRNFRLPRTRLVALLVGCMPYGALLHPVILLVLSHTLLRCHCRDDNWQRACRGPRCAFSRYPYL